MKNEVLPKKIKKKYTSGIPGHVIDAEYFYYDTIPSGLREMAVVCGGHEKCAPDFEINRNNYPFFFVKYTLKGKGTLEINNQVLSLKPGVLTGFEPGTAHHYTADPTDPMEHIFITFIGQQASELFHKSALSQRHFIEASDPEAIVAMCQKILDLGLQKPAFSQEICCSYLHILLLEYASHFSCLTSNIPISMKTFQRCKRYIDNNFSTILSPNHVADQCDLDVRYLAFLFKKYGNNTPSEYITRLKMNKAANLLLTTDFKIKDIAYHVGFYDPYHFSKIFKKTNGQSPKKYRSDHMPPESP